MDYRREIDGLRAIAVVPVIFFHAGFEAFSGGFVGVDVFFVISGYLITSIILAEQEQGTFSIVNFYERRARRILPALFFVMFVSLPFAWLWLRPSDLKDFFQSVVGVSVFSSNILFWLESGYFEAAAELKPLLHTWSLAVEEQYYVLFPLFLIMLWAIRKRWILGALVFVGISSLAYAQWSSINQPEAGFFLLPARAWELMIGAYAAFLLLYGQSHLDRIVSSNALRETLGVIGAGLLAYSVVYFDETVPFPSVWALVPTIGTVLLILFATSETSIGRILGNRILVAIGLVSYSAYLWHQPLFAFARHRSLGVPSEQLFMGLSILTIVLAYISWRFIEKPFRSRTVVSRKAIFTSAVAGSAMFIGVGVIGHISNGFDGRVGKDGVMLTELDNRIRVNQGLSRECEGKFTLSPKCRTSDDPEIVVWGDSLAMHLVQGIMSSNPSAKIVQMTKSVCGPFFGLAPTDNKYPVPWAEGCLEFNDRVHEYIASSKSIKYVVLSSSFYAYVPGGFKLFVDGVVRDQDAELVLAKLLGTLEELERLGVRPIIFSPTPSNGSNIGQCLVKASYFGDALDSCNFDYSDLNRSKVDVFDFLSSVALQYPVVWLSDYICSDGVCSAHIDSTFIYRDSHHLSHEGSAMLGLTSNFFGLIVGDAGREAATISLANDRSEY